MKYGKELQVSQTLMSSADFLKLYNENMPASFPRASIASLQKFRETHAMLFINGDLWSLDRHRKKLMDWLPQNSMTL